MRYNPEGVVLLSSVRRDCGDHFCIPRKEAQGLNELPGLESQPGLVQLPSYPKHTCLPPRRKLHVRFLLSLALRLKNEDNDSPSATSTA